MRPLRWFLKEEQGQDLIEYALLASFLAIASIAAVKVLGGKVSAFYNTIGAQF